MNSDFILTVAVKHTTKSKARLVPHRERLALMDSPHLL